MMMAMLRCARPVISKTARGCHLLHCGSGLPWILSSITHQGAFMRATEFDRLYVVAHCDSGSARTYASAPEDGDSNVATPGQLSGEKVDEFEEFGEVDDFEDRSVFDAVENDHGENSGEDRFANDRLKIVQPNLGQKMVAEFLNNMDYDVRYTPKYDVDYDDEQAIANDACRMEDEEIFVKEDLGFETEDQYKKLNKKIAKMTRVVARELGRQGLAKPPEDLTTLLHEPPEFLHNARIKYTYHRYDHAQVNVLDEHPGNHKVTLKVHVPHLDLDADQTAYLSEIAGNRYSNATKNLKLVSRKHLNRLLNRIHVRILLDRILAEVEGAKVYA